MITNLSALSVLNEATEEYCKAEIKRMDLDYNYYEYHYRAFNLILKKSLERLEKIDSIDFDLVQEAIDYVEEAVGYAPASMTTEANLKLDYIQTVIDTLKGK